ncbi:O-antigen ligase family protein [Altericista sp. CCNU0014]|uniref:O-antigen ligase family protein n=1 Tax=Altericista sp. CCNU0014 TaxID=3082949 RepID=UPI00384BD436
MVYSKYLIGVIGVLIGIASIFLTGTKSLFVISILFIPVLIRFFFKNFEVSVVGLLILRSALDPFTDRGLTGAFAVGLSGLTIIYTIVRLLSKQKVQIDSFFCFFALWVVLQGLWVVLLPLGGLGFGGEYLSDAVREWVRIFSWLMAYLLTLQLKERLSPEKFVNYLFLALAIPIGVAFLQLLVPDRLLPTFLAINRNQESLRINGTLGVANTFATFLVFFIGLTYWKLNNTQKRLPWVLLLIVLVFFLVNTQTLVGITMLLVLIPCLILSQLNFRNLISSVLLISLMFGIFLNTDFGQERLASIAQTPLFNSDIDISRAVLLSSQDSNSFNWRIAQWTALLNHWKFSPVLGYGLQMTDYLGPMFAWAHNDYIRVLVEEGVVGFTLFLLFLGTQLLRLLRLIVSPLTVKSQKSFCLTLFANMLAIMVGMLTENIWSHTALFFYWFSISAIANWSWGDPEGKLVLTPEPKIRLTHFG